MLFWQIIFSSIDNSSTVSLNINVMCMRLENKDKGEVHRAIPQFYTEYTYTLYFNTLY
jgi:hypothetical protein